jgi:hypothetical protein
MLSLFEEKMGYQVLEKQQKQILDVIIENYKMQKTLI